MPLLYHEIKDNYIRHPSYGRSNFPAEFYQLEICDSLAGWRCLIKPKMSGYVIVPEINILL